MKRREFVYQGSTIVAGSMILACNPSLIKSNTATRIPDQEKFKLKEAGIQLYSLRNELPDDREGVLQKISGIGYKYLETFLLQGQHHLGYPIEEYKQMLDDLGLQVVSAHIPTGRNNPDLEGTLVNNFEKVIEDANFLGQSYIVCPWLGEDERSSIDKYKETIELLNNCGEKCKQAGIQMAYHNHEFEFFELEGQIPLEVMIRETDPELVQFELDIYWSTFANFDAVELFNKYPGRFPLWHVKDMSKINRDETTFLGDGSIDYREIFKSASKAGLDYHIVEQEDYPIPVFEGLEKSLEYINSIEV